MIATDLKTGKIFKEGDFPFVVVKYEHTKTARAGATVKVKAKNLITGAMMEKGFLGGAKVEEADVIRKNAQYLYKNGNGYEFMDPVSYEQIHMSEEIVGDNAPFLIEGETVQVLYFEDQPVSIDLPLNMVYEVTYTEPGFKGNTVSNVLKEATMRNGLIAKVPTFIKIGERVRIDTRTGEYVSRA